MENINFKNEVLNILIKNQEKVTIGQHHDSEDNAVLSGSYEYVIESICGLLIAIDEEKTIDFLYSKD